MHRRLGWWAVPVVLLLAACGAGEGAGTGDADMGVEPGAAMDTTPAGTPAPPDAEVVPEAQGGR